MRVALIGNNFCGKTTVFSLLAGIGSSNNSFKKSGVNVAAIDIKDSRVDFLSKKYNPKKTIYAKIDFVDANSLDKGNNSAVSSLKADISKYGKIDAFALVVDNFSQDFSFKKIQEQVNLFETEMILSDQITVETRLKNLAETIKKSGENPAVKLESLTLQMCLEALNKEDSLSSLILPKASFSSIKGITLLSQKPLFVIINSSEVNFGKLESEKAKLKQNYIDLAGKFEQELLDLTPQESLLFREEMGIGKPAIIRLTSFIYKALGYISFFTVGQDEVRAWTITDGDSAKTAAGKIHSDIKRGFIRAECFAYNAIESLKSEKLIRAKGQMRLEGKEYVVEDGDIINFRFNI